MYIKFVWQLCSFLVSARKEQKEADLRGAECRAPARQSRPLKKPPARIAVGAERLNLGARQIKSVPTFDFLGEMGAGKKFFFFTSKN